MNKELEALKRLLPYLPEGDLLEDEVRILTLALERKEELEKAFDTLLKENEKIMKELSLEIEKNKSLQIIREKLVDLSWLAYALNSTSSIEKALNVYNDKYAGNIPLTLEEISKLNRRLEK